MPVDKILYPTRKEIVDYYSKKTGFNVENINWYYAFGAFKLAVIITTNLRKISKRDKLKMRDLQILVRE
ncbi:MAG: hypothetical protein CM15mP114_14340 [Alphaproteobacteria bacterium]|nr:MAG: hypothetical protein CM15mP114_14340 [Alphaproteobacteria bacterium]